jgi:hypothetical protein
MEKREIERVKAMVGKHLTRASVDSEGLVSLEYEGGLHLVVAAVRAGRNPSSQPLAEFVELRSRRREIEWPEAERAAREEEIRLIRLERASDAIGWTLSSGPWPSTVAVRNGPTEKHRS